MHQLAANTPRKLLENKKHNKVRLQDAEAATNNCGNLTMTLNFCAYFL